MSLINEIFYKILDFLVPLPKDRKPPCPKLCWTLPDNLRPGKERSMKPVCDLGLKTGPTCGGFFKKEPNCGSYELTQKND